MAIGKQPDSSAPSDADDDGETIFAEINITPLTDVFLVMVVIFMVSALAVQAEHNSIKKIEKERIEQQQEEDKRRGLQINLPAGEAAQINPTAPSIVLEIPPQGSVYMGGRALTDPELAQVFQAAYTRDKGTQVIFKADKDASHGRIVDVMERAQKVGLAKFAFPTGAGK